MSKNKYQGKNNSYLQQRSKDIYHVTIQGHNRSLPSHVDKSELLKLYNHFRSEIKEAKIVSSSEIPRLGKISFKSMQSSSNAREALHGKKLANGASLTVRYWRKEDDEKAEEVSAPKAGVSTTTVEVSAPSIAKMEGPTTKAGVSAPKTDVSVPKTEVSVPKSAAKVDVSAPKAEGSATKSATKAKAEMSAAKALVSATKAERSATKTEVSATKAEKSAIKTEVSAAKAEGSAAKAEVSTAKVEVSAPSATKAVVSVPKSATKVDMSAPKAEGSATKLITKAQGSVLKAQLSATKSEVSSTKMEVSAPSATKADMSVPKMEESVPKSATKVASKAEGSAAKAQVSAPKAQVSAPKAQLSATKEEVSTTEMEVAAPSATMSAPADVSVPKTKVSVPKSATKVEVPVPKSATKAQVSAAKAQMSRTKGEESARKAEVPAKVSVRKAEVSAPKTVVVSATKAKVSATKANISAPKMVVSATKAEVSAPKEIEVCSPVTGRPCSPTILGAHPPIMTSCTTKSESEVLRTLYVGIRHPKSPNDQSVQKNDLQSHFDQFKYDITKVSPILGGANGEYAFITFKSRKVASEAIRSLNGSFLLGHQLKVSFKIVKKDAAVEITPSKQGAIPHPPVKSKEPLSKTGFATPAGLGQSRSAKKDEVIIGHDQIVLEPFYEPICSSSAMEECKRSLLQRYKGDVVVCRCMSTPATSSMVGQAFLRVSQNHVVAIKISVGSLNNETADAIVVPTERTVAAYMYPIAMRQPSLKVSQNGNFSNKLFNDASPPLVEIAQTACLKAKHLSSCSHIIQVLFPLREQTATDDLSCNECIRNCITLATQMGFGSVSFPGITTQMIGSIVACVSGLASTTLHTVSVVLGTPSEARQFSIALNLCATISSGSQSEEPKSKKSYSNTVQASTSATSLTNPQPSSVFVWSWRENDGSFIPYTPSMAKGLEQAYQKDISSLCRVTINGTTYYINFMTMKQTNAVTKFERTIKRSTIGGDHTCAVWRYKDDNSQFSPYSPGDSAKIEEMYQKQDDSYLVISKRTYRFDFPRMKQINVMTGYERDVCRGFESQRSTPKKAVFLSNGEVVVNISGPLSVLPAIKKTLEGKIKALLFSKTIPYPAISSQPLLSKVQAIAKKHNINYTIGEGGESGASNVSKQVLTIQGLQEIVEKAQTEIQELILAFHVSFDQLPKSSRSSHNFPQEWETMALGQQVKFVNLSRSSSEFGRVQRRFEETMSKTDYIITQIQQVQNKYFWTRFQQSKLRLHTKDALMVNEKKLFHGTRKNPPKTICSSEEGFDMRFSREGMWGQANYFAAKAKYSETYAYHDADKQTNEMILAKVLTGDSFYSKPDSTLRMPPLKKQHGQAGEGELQQVRYDSVNGETNGSQVYMTYANDLAYPAFIITYSRAFGPRPRVMYQPPPPPPPKPPPPRPPPSPQQSKKSKDVCTIS